MDHRPWMWCDGAARYVVCMWCCDRLSRGCEWLQPLLQYRCSFGSLLLISCPLSFFLFYTIPRSCSVSRLFSECSPALHCRRINMYGNRPRSELGFLIFRRTPCKAKSHPYLPARPVMKLSVAAPTARWVLGRLSAGYVVIPSHCGSLFEKV